MYQSSWQQVKSSKQEVGEERTQEALPAVDVSFVLDVCRSVEAD